MAYSEELASRLLDEVADESDIDTRKMFGGLVVMWRGNMLCGVMGDDLMVRVGPDRYVEYLELPGAREMDFTGRPMKGMLTVAADAIEDEVALSAWVQRCREFVGGLPAK